MLDQLDAFSLTSSSIAKRQSQNKKQASLAYLLDSSFDLPPQNINPYKPQSKQRQKQRERQPSSSPSRDRIERMTNFKQSIRGQEKSLNNSFYSKGSKSSLSKPPKPTQKASKLASLGQPIKPNQNKHPCFQNSKHQIEVQQYNQHKNRVKRTNYQQKTSSKNKQLQRSSSRQIFKPATKVIKDVMMIRDGKMVKQDVVISLNQEGEVNSFDQSFVNFQNKQRGRKNYHQQNTFRTGSSLITSSMIGRAQSPAQCRMDKTLNSIQRKNRSRSRQGHNQSFFQTSYDYYYEDDVRTTALQQFMIGTENKSDRRVQNRYNPNKIQKINAFPIRGELPAGRKMKLSQLMK